METDSSECHQEEKSYKRQKNKAIQAAVQETVKLLHEKGEETWVGCGEDKQEQADGLQAEERSVDGTVSLEHRLAEQAGEHHTPPHRR